MGVETQVMPLFSVIRLADMIYRPLIWILIGLHYLVGLYERWRYPDPVEGFLAGLAPLDTDEIQEEEARLRKRMQQ